MKYTWDDKKNASNYEKHGVWFEEAQTVFSDTNALEAFDGPHSEDEERFIVLGLSTLPRLLIIVFCERIEEEIRIISARKATKMEARSYER